MEKGLINYTEIWNRIAKLAKKAGRAGTRPVLLLYYVMKSKETPKADKLLILSALSYIILPIDFISAKRLPIIGWFDEIASLTVAYKKVRKHITPEMEAKADEQLDKWFPEGVTFEMIEEE